MNSIDSNSITFSVKVSASLLNRLQNVAVQRGMAPSTLGRELIEDGLREMDGGTPERSGSETVSADVDRHRNVSETYVNNKN